MNTETKYCTAASLRALLCYLNSGVTVDIAFDKDELAPALIEKVKNAVGARGGSQGVSIHFGEDDQELKRQFEGCASHVEAIFKGLKGDFRG